MTSKETDAMWRTTAELPAAIRLAEHLESELPLGHMVKERAAAKELRRLHAVNTELLEAAKNVLSHKRGEDDWLILAVHCRDLEAAIAKATGEQA